MELSKSISIRIIDSATSTSSFQRLAANLQSRGRQDLVDRCLETYVLLKSWNRNESTCLAGILCVLAIHKNFLNDCLMLDFEAEIGENVRQLAAGVVRVVVSISSTNRLGLDPTAKITDTETCNIIAALSLVTAKSLNDWAVNDSKAIISKISTGMCPEGYEYCLSSNVLLGLPANIHKLAQEHALNQLLGSPVHRLPCRHAFAENVFPDSYYAAMLRLLPSIPDYQTIPKASAYNDACKQILGVQGQRHSLWLRDLKSSSRQFRDLERDQESQFWCSLANSLADSSFVSGVVAAFLESSQDEVDVAIRLVQETGAAYIAPHLDMPHKRLSLLFYLENAQSESAQGTSLYEVDEKSGVSRARRTLPFSPNSALILPRTDNSWHGVEPHRLNLPRVTLHAYLQSRDYKGTKAFPSQ